MDTQPTKPKRADYKAVLDTPLSPKKRKIAVAMLEADSLQQVARDTGTSPDNIYKAAQDEAVLAPKAAALVSRDAAMRKILDFCEDILNRDIETPLKASDKVAAARLYAEISGVLEEKKGNTINIGVLDLRQATTAELEAELAKTEAMKRDAIDVQVVE